MAPNIFCENCEPNYQVPTNLVLSDGKSFKQFSKLHTRQFQLSNIVVSMFLVRHIDIRLGEWSSKWTSCSFILNFLKPCSDCKGYTNESVTSPASSSYFPFWLVYNSVTLSLSDSWTSLFFSLWSVRVSLGQSLFRLITGIFSVSTETAFFQAYFWTQLVCLKN